MDDLGPDNDNPYTCLDTNWPVVLLFICMLDAHTPLIDGHSVHLIYTFTGAAPGRQRRQYSLRSGPLWQNTRTPVVSDKNLIFNIFIWLRFLQCRHLLSASPLAILSVFFDAILRSRITRALWLLLASWLPLEMLQRGIC